MTSLDKQLQRIQGNNLSGHWDWESGRELCLALPGFGIKQQMWKTISFIKKGWKRVFLLSWLVCIGLTGEVAGPTGWLENREAGRK